MEVRRWTPDLDGALLAFLGDEADGRGHCFCAAWWCPTWDEWKGRTAAQNRAARADLVSRGERDGYVLLDGGRVVGWCQAGPRDRLAKLVSQYGLAPDPAMWAVTCFEIAPAHRGKGAAALLLRGALEDLRARGATRVQGFPAPGAGLEPGRAWTGPGGLFRSAGFLEAGRAARGPVMELRF